MCYAHSHTLSAPIITLSLSLTHSRSLSHTLSVFFAQLIGLHKQFAINWHCMEPEQQWRGKNAGARAGEREACISSNCEVVLQFFHCIVSFRFVLLAIRCWNNLSFFPQQIVSTGFCCCFAVCCCFFCFVYCVIHKQRLTLIRSLCSICSRHSGQQFNY